MDTTRFFHLLNGSITQGNLQRWVKQDLKQLGIKLPKDKKTKKLNLSRVYSHPEVCLVNLACTMYFWPYKCLCISNIFSYKVFIAKRYINPYL